MKFSPLEALLAVAMVAFVVFAAASCTNESATVRTLEDEGYTEIRTTGYEWFGCSKDDGFHTGFVAKNVKGKVVTGVVCCGLLKSCTVRH